MKRIDKRKVALVVGGILMISVGVVLMICGITNTAPGTDNKLNTLITVFCAYGLLFGAGFMMGGFGLIMDAVTMKPRKRAR